MKNMKTIHGIEYTAVRGEWCEGCAGEFRDDLCKRLTDCGFCSDCLAGAPCWSLAECVKDDIIWKRSVDVVQPESHTNAPTTPSTPYPSHDTRNGQTALK